MDYKYPDENDQALHQGCWQEWRGSALGVYSPLESPMSSYHIQDLRLVLPALDFELRVNKHYAKPTRFREWLQELLHGDVVRAEELSNHRFDLLCSLCFPTIDPPQLLRVSKLCALTFLANDGHIQAETSSSRWLTGYVPCVEPVFNALNQSAVHSDSTPHPDLLSPDHLLEVARSMRTRQAQELENPRLPLRAPISYDSLGLFRHFTRPKRRTRKALIQAS
jgi:hypothetical protein